MAVMRSWFYVPGNSKEELDAALTYEADIIVIDLEDLVPPPLKTGARQLVRENLKYAKSGASEVWVRVNDYSTNLTTGDLDAVVYPGLDGVVLTKVSGAGDVKRLALRLEELERDRDMEIGGINICLLLETAMGVIHAYEACSASPRVKAAIFGAVDYTCDMQVNQTPEATEQTFARSLIGVACRAAGIVAVDAPFLDYEDMDAFRENVLVGRQLGFNGRMILHPSMIDISNKMYAPDPAEIAWAREIKNVFETEGLAKGKGGITYKGKLVDTPVYNKALGILAKQQEIDEKNAQKIK